MSNARDELVDGILVLQVSCQPIPKRVLNRTEGGTIDEGGQWPTLLLVSSDQGS